MTRTDLLIMFTNCNKNIETLQGDEKLKKSLCNDLELMHNILDTFWIDMLEINDVINKHKSLNNSNDSNDSSYVGILKVVRDKFAKNFKEDNYYKD